MAKEMCLLADIEGLGSQGDVVRVKEGYARNFLLPKGLGAPVTEATRRKLAKLQEQRAAELAQKLEESRQIADRIQKASCTIPVKTGQDDKLFGAVTAQQIADTLKAQDIVIDRHQIVLDEPIRELGVIPVPVKLHPKLTVTLKVWIVKE